MSDFFSSVSSSSSKPLEKHFSETQQTYWHKPQPQLVWYTLAKSISRGLSSHIFRLPPFKNVILKIHGKLLHKDNT